ncbi:unnamed protein product [Symbiodinium sp. CCMP2456]|nr:unnamed protein product [Symbiodinium sp. CCMP2456]
MASPGPGARDARSPRTSPRTSPRSDAGRTGLPSRVQAPAEASIPASSFWAPPNRSRTSSTATAKSTASRSPRASPPSPTAEPTTKAWVRLLDKVSAVLEAEDRNKAKAAAGAEESFDVGQPSPPSEPKSFRTSPDARDPLDVVPRVTSQAPSLTRTSQESESSLPATSVEVIELTLHCQQSGAVTDDVNSNASTSVAAEKPDQEAVSLSEAARSVIAPCASRETSVSAASRATSVSRTQPSTAPGPRAVVLSSARVTGPNGLLPLAAYTTSSGPVKSWTPIWNQQAPVVFPASPAATGRPCGSPLTSSPRVHQVESPRMPRQDGVILGLPCQSGPGSPVGSRATHVEGHVFRTSQPSSSQHKEVSPRVQFALLLPELDDRQGWFRMVLVGTFGAVE